MRDRLPACSAQSNHACDRGYGVDGLPEKRSTADCDFTLRSPRYAQELWMGNLGAGSRGVANLGAVLEVDSSNDVSEERVSVELPPLALGGLSELEDHRQPRCCGA